MSTTILIQLQSFAKSIYSKKSNLEVILIISEDEDYISFLVEYQYNVVWIESHVCNCIF